MIDEKVLNFARESLRKRAEALESVQFTNVIQRDFSFGQVKAGIDVKQTQGWITSLLSADTNSATIYRLSVNTQEGADRLNLAFQDYVRPDGVKMTRNNRVAGSRIVYVGSSRNIRQRLVQHLKNCPDSTYALKMNRWCPNTEDRLNVEIIVVRGKENQALVQDVEDSLWIRSRPMFGKLGPR